MTSRIPPAGTTWLMAILLAVVVSVMAVATSPVLAQSAEETPPSETPATDSEPAPPTEKEIKQAAKEARIAEYLRRREDRRQRKLAQQAAAQEPLDLEAAKELEQQQLTAPPLAAPPPQAAPPAAPQPAVVAPFEAAAEPPAAQEATPVLPAPRQARPASQPRKPTALPRDLARAQANIRAIELGQDPTVQTYLDRIDRQDASPGQLAAFGSFLAQNGLLRDAVVYYQVALKIDPLDPLLWVNFGTLHRQMKEMSAARSAYQRALTLDSNNAFAHYNLGAVLDESGKYDAAIAEYRIALSLDPSLGDPVQNPQAANNRLLAAVKLMQYHEQIGSLGLPLVEIPTEPEAELDPAQE